MKNNSSQTLLSVKELAARWRLNRKTIYVQIRRGQLPNVKIGRALRIPLSLVESIEQGGAVLGGVP
jgi:excisionase family DNA binding protein